MTQPVSARDSYPRQRVDAGGVKMAYIDEGRGDSIVFVHGNPTSSFLWRNVIPHLVPGGRCLVPDLVGMGDSDRTLDGSYRFKDHSRHLDEWFEAVVPEGQVTLVLHDWGSALGFYWAHRHPERVKGLAYMEAIVRPLTWADWPEQARRVFQGFRSPAGDEMVLEKNVFVERVLPGSVLRSLTEEEMTVYRRPYLEPGESRRPTLTWPREIPFDGHPADVTSIVSEYGQWLSTSEVPKLFVNADPGAMLTGSQREFCRSWPNQREVTVRGSHFIQEDSPNEIGAALADWFASL